MSLFWKLSLVGVAAFIILMVVLEWFRRRRDLIYWTEWDNKDREP